MPGVPLTLGNVPEVLQCLQAALQAGDMQKQAEAHLQGMEDRQGFCSCLAEIILDKDADHSARWLASVQLKNMVSKYWRSRPDPKFVQNETLHVLADTVTYIHSNRQRSISKEEKAHVRSKLPQLVVQDDSQIAVQIALTWAKVARQDYPQDCPSLFTDLLSMLSAPGATPLVVRRALLVVHHTTKELATKRLAADQRNFAQVASQLSGPMWSQWCADTASLISGLPTASAPDLGTAAVNGQVQQLLLTLERWLLLLKVLRRLLVFGHVSDHKSLQPVQEVCVCAPAMLQALQQLISIRPGLSNRPISASGSAPGDSSSNGGHRPAANPQRHQLGVMLDRGLLKLTKVMGAIQEAHPWSFHASGALIHTLSFCCEQVNLGLLSHVFGVALACLCSQLMANQAHGGGVTAASTSWDRFLIQCITFIMNTMTCDAYKGKTSSGSELTDHEQDLPHRGLVSEVSSSLSSWWTQERLTGLTNALVTGYMILTGRDLEEWSASSEEFYHAGDVSGWQEHVGLAAEALYLILIKDHRTYLGPQIIQLLQDASAACPLTVVATQPENLPGASVVVGHGPSAVRYPSAVLAYDAVLSAVAKGAYELHDYLDFSSWLRAHILPILSTTGPMLRVLRRQALRVVASWVARLQDVDRDAVYLAVLTCMAEDDETMQLTSVSCLHALVDDWNFSEEGFEACVGTSMQLLLRVLSGCSQLDSQTQAFNLMNLIIERMGDLIKPWVEPLSGLLPGLWAAAEGQSLLRIQVLLALQRLVNVLGVTSPALYPLLLPLLTYATDPNQPEALHLLEDGLGLWLVALRNAPSSQPLLLALLPHIPAILNTSTEHIAMCMALVTSAAIMARDALVTQVHDVCAAFTCMMGSVNEKGMLVLLPALEMVLAASPQCVEGLRPATSKLLALLLGGQETPLVQAVGCCVFSRLLLVAPGELALLLSSLSGAPAAAGHLSRLLEMWTEGFDALGQPRQRKLSALGLCGVIAHAPSPPVIQMLDVILACVTGVWAELEGGGPSASQEEDASAWAMLAAVDSGFEAALSVAVASEDAEGECTRRAAMRANDPVARASLRDALRSALETARASLGQTLNAALAALDPSLGAQLQGMMSSTAVPPPL